MVDEIKNKFLNKSQFAVTQGYSPSYVTKLKKQGRLVMCSFDSKLIDVDATVAFFVLYSVAAFAADAAQTAVALEIN